MAKRKTWIEQSCSRGRKNRDHGAKTINTYPKGKMHGNGCVRCSEGCPLWKYHKDK